MAEAKSKILIVEDDLDVANMLNAYFHVQGYEVFVANRGEDGVLVCQAAHPSLIILDICLPDINGYEVARRLRGNLRTVDIPIIFLSEKSDRPDLLQGLELGADDYISKPFDIQELQLRVHNVLRRSRQDSLNNPVTGLPDGTLVDERLNECLQKPDWTMLIVSLENLDAFCDAYGFVASDDVLRAVSLMVYNAIREIGSAEDFLGHLDPTVFVLITGQERAASLQARIRTRLEQSLDYFYPIKDRDRSATRSKWLSFKIGILRSSDGPFISLDVLKLFLLRKKQ
jgi:DNA-binding response OmpR family regulator